MSFNIKRCQDTTDYETLEDSSQQVPQEALHTSYSCCCCWITFPGPGFRPIIHRRILQANEAINLDQYGATPPGGNCIENESIVDTAWLALQRQLSALTNTDSNETTEYKLGRVEFKVSYDNHSSTLNLRIVQAVDLPAMDRNGTSDPYCKIIMLPDSNNKLTTRVQYKTLSPRWNEAFSFEGYPFDKLVQSTMCLQVLDYDRFSKDDIIGEVILPMTAFDLNDGHETSVWKNLQPSQRLLGRLGELCLSIYYDPTNSQLAVTVVRARNLKIKEVTGTSDSYVKIWLIQKGKKINKKKTTTRQKTLNPIFEEMLCFSLTTSQVRYTCLDITVMNNVVGRNEPIGHVLLGSKSGPIEVKHWAEIFTNSCKTPVTQWHVLKKVSGRMSSTWRLIMGSDDDVE